MGQGRPQNRVLSALDLDFSLEATGFVEPQIDAIMFGGNARSAADKLLPLPIVATSRLDDLWLLGKHKLFCGDSTQSESLAALLGGEPVRAVFTDIPYNCRVQGHVTGSSAHGEFVMALGELSDAAFTEFMAKSLMRISEALIPGGVAYFCIDWRNAEKVFEGVKRAELEMMNLVVWDKQSGGMGSWYRSRHELIFVLRKGGAGHLNRVELGKHGRDRHNIWCYPGVNGFGAQKAKAREMHPTVKPLNLVRDAILDCSARGDLILDLFSGSGTTIVAAHQSGRRGAAIDLDPRYVDTGVIRWQDFSGQEAVLAVTGQTFREVRAKRAAPNAPLALPPELDSQARHIRPRLPGLASLAQRYSRNRRY